MKSVSRFVREHAGEWRPIHSAIVGCLLAHRNGKSRRCFPSRTLLAKHCNVSERTIDRAVAQLRGWGAVETSQPRLVSGQMGRRQYTLAFEPAPQDIALSLSPQDKAVSAPGDKAVSATGRQKPSSPGDKAVSATGRQKPGDKAVSVEAKALELEAEVEVQVEAHREVQGGSFKQQDLKTPSQNLIPYEHATQEQRLMRGKAMAAWSRGEMTYERLQQAIAKSGCGPISGEPQPSPPRGKFSKNDFDERDLRKLQVELEKIYRSLEGARIVDSEYEREEGRGTHSHEQIFAQACARAGIPTRRGLELSDAEWKKKNPGRQAFDDAKPRTG